MANLHDMLKELIERGGSDLHITTNSPPQVRVDGDLTPLGHAAAESGGDQAALLQRADGDTKAQVRGGK